MLLNHNKICKINSLPFYLLFFNNFISSFLKKGFCRNRSVCCDISFNCLLKLIANSGSNSSPLIVCMNKQTVKVSRFVYISKSYNNFILNGYYTVMFLK